MKRAGLWSERRMRRGMPPTLAAAAITVASLLATAVAESEPRVPAQNRMASSRSLAEDELARAVMLEARADVALALSAYTAAIRIDPSLGAAYLGLARLRERLNDRREAELLYSRAIMIGDVRGRALLGRALLRHGEGRRREALLDLQQSVELDSNPAALQTLAGWYAQSHN